MDNPLQLLTEIFHPVYRVNLSLEHLDGSLTLTLSDARQRVVKHRISAAQCRDRRLLQSVVERVQRELASPGPAPATPELEPPAPGCVRGLSSCIRPAQPPGRGLSTAALEEDGVEGKRAEA